MSERATAERYEVPRTALQDRFKAVKQGLKPTLGRFQQTFTPEYERQLSACYLTCRLMPLTRSEILRFAYDLIYLLTYSMVQGPS